MDGYSNGILQCNQMVSLTSQIDKLPVHCINASNLQRYGAEINQNILESQLISIDLEMSGLGDMQKKKGGSNDINVRYSAIKEATEEFGIISLGISCFKSNDMQSDTNICYSCNAYSFLICSSEKISFNFKSANFLSSHDFDFNELFTNAILYQPAFLPTNPEENPKKSIKDDEYQNEKLLNQFISNIFQNCKKICFHNGFIDMMFIYSHFFCRLPSNLNTFVQDITVLCGNSLYDTKLISIMLEIKASYLVYVFRKMQRINENSSIVSFDFKVNDSNLVDYRFCFCGLTPTQGRHKICDRFAKYGWCSNDVGCHQSHNIDHILDRDEGKSRKNTSSESIKANEVSNLEMPSTSHSDSSQLSQLQKSTHRSGFDSFMCGYALLIFLNHKVFTQSKSEWFGKMALPGYDIPLVFTPSQHYKNSKDFLSYYNDSLSHVALAN